MRLLLSILLFVSCATVKPNPPAPAPVRAEADWSGYWQNIVDSCIANNITDYWIGSGNWYCAHPIIAKYYPVGATYYVPFTLVLHGGGKFAGKDGTGTIFRFADSCAFGFGWQGAKGGGIDGIKLIGGWDYKFPGAYAFYNTPLYKFTDGHSRDSQFSPYTAFAVDPFGPSIPSDGGFPGTDAYGTPLSTYYKGQINGSTGVTIDNCFFTNWTVGIIVSPNGHTQNGELILGDRIQFANMKICVAGCQDQEKMNHFSNLMVWGGVNTIFATGIYGAGSPGIYYFDHLNIAGTTQQIVYNNQTGYGPCYFSDVFAESIARIGPMYSVNGSTFSNAQINFAGYKEAGSYTSDMISGYGVTFIGCQFRLYGQFSPVTIWTGSGSNMMHFRDCSFDVVPIYPQSYGGGYSDFQNCIAGQVYNILNPLGPQTARVPVSAYGTTSTLAAKAVPVDRKSHQLLKAGVNFSSVIQSDSTVKVKDVILASLTGEFMDVAGIVTAVGQGNFTVSYSPASIDSTKQYFLYNWKPIMK